MHHRYFIAAVLAAGAIWACSGEQPDSFAASGAESGSSTSGDATSTNATGNTGAAVSVASSSSGMGFDCDPPAEAGSLYEISEEPLYELEHVSMCQYRNDVMLIVNTAAIWGSTPQMGPLQVMEDKYKDQGFHVLGFFSNDFGNQGGSNEQIEACTDTHAVDFQLFKIDKVVNPPRRPVFDWLLSQSNPGPSTSLPPTWNFHKYLVSRTGQLIATWPRAEWPGDDPTDPTQGNIAAAIEAALAQ